MCDVVSRLHMEPIFCLLADEIRAVLAGNGPVSLCPPQRGFEFCGYLLQWACCELVKQLHYEPTVSALLRTIPIRYDRVLAICISIISGGMVTLKQVPITNCAINYLNYNQIGSTSIVKILNKINKSQEIYLRHLKPINRQKLIYAYKKHFSKLQIRLC